jgi:hypothetical protein
VRSEVPFLRGQRAPTLFIGAAASHCAPAATEGGTGSQASAFAPLTGGGRGGQIAGQRRARRSASAGAAHGGEGRPAGAALGPGVAGPLRAYTMAYGGEARRTRRAGAARRRVPAFACYGLPWFDCDFLPKF